MTPQFALVLSLVVPLIGGFLIASNDKHPDAREAVTIVTSLVLFAIVLYLLGIVVDGARPAVTLLYVMPGVPLYLSIEPIGMMFATVASGLWIVNSIYSIGYMRGNKEHKQTRFYICFAIAIASTMGIAFAGNLITLFIFYEALTLSTYPLVAHKETEEARHGARVYIGLLLTTSIVFFLTAIIWTWAITDTLDFTAGGILAGHIEGPMVGILLALYMFGIGKAALMPFHRWLPEAMVAPTPVSALLHAVAVVKAGVFTVVKVGVYVFGIEFLAASDYTDWLMWIAAVTLIGASVIALTKDDLKARLAYSTVSQLAYITLGVSLATSMGVIGGTLQIAAHALGKITLFMCAGSIYVATHKTRISEMRGLGRVMPFTFAAFLIGSLSIIGLPPFGGAWSKWYLMLASIDAGELVMIGVLMVSSLLNIAYLIPVVARGFFLPLSDQEDRPQPVGREVSAIRISQIKEAPIFCVVPPLITAAGCIVLFFMGETVYGFIATVFVDGSIAR